MIHRPVSPPVLIFCLGPNTGFSCPLFLFSSLMLALLWTSAQALCIPTPATTAIVETGMVCVPGIAGSSTASLDLCLPLVGSSGATWGMAVCKNGTTRPIFISVGHRLSLATATQLVLSCMLHRVPEPIRQADLQSRQAIRERLRKR